MWINDDKLRDLIAKLRTDAEESGDYAYGEAADALVKVIKEEQAMLPPPTGGSTRCMIYTGDPR